MPQILHEPVVLSKLTEKKKIVPVSIQYLVCCYGYNKGYCSANTLVGSYMYMYMYM